MIIRGTTPYHSFVLPLSSSQISNFYVTYTQNGEIVIDKQMGADGVEIADVNLSTENANVENLQDEEIEIDEQTTGSKITIHLTQEETLGFHFYPAAEKNLAIIQIRILDTDGEAYASTPVQERIFGVIKDGVIGNEESTTEDWFISLN